jgi:predicted XRE-type DNA-binding protein
MGTDTSSALDETSVAGATPKPPRDEVMRIATMTKQILDLHQELYGLALPLTDHTELSDTELRRAHAQLAGWLQGLLQTAQTATGTSTSSDLEPRSPAIRSARQALVTAITRRITQKRLTAAQAAALLHLTGPRVTKLLQANIDEFTLDELVNLLPALELTIQVVPTPEQYVGHSRRRECPND